MNMHTTHRPPDAAPPVALLRALSPGWLASADERQRRLVDLFAAFDRDDVEAGVDLLIAALDAADGEADSEASGDELDCDHAEDDFMRHSIPDAGPGCPVADGNCSRGHSAADHSWTEWDTRGRHKLDRFGSEPGREAADDSNMAHEDAEEDEPVEDDDPAELDYRDHDEVMS